MNPIFNNWLNPFSYVLCLLLLVFNHASANLEDHPERMKKGLALFKSTIRPALEQHCLKCHGDEKVRADLDFSTRELLLKGGESGPAIDLKKPKESFLLVVIRHEDEPEMPPKKDKLPAELANQFEKWISLGAPYDKPLIDKTGNESKELTVTDSDREFWSFRPLTKPKPPTTQGKWAKSDIDRFVQAKHSENGLKPNPPVSDQARIRRTYLDLIGLLPTIEQLQEAQNLTQAELIDQLLESPHYGERWARHWLDAARFAESHGFEQDYDRKFAYHYRDFVIKALNQNMPWDQFVSWQLAGDEIAPEDPLAMMATGFLGAGVFPTQLTEKEFESARYDELDDMASTMGTAMLGLTIGCARCHDHKFDPIPVKDYYQLLSTFTTTIRSEIDLNLDEKEYPNKLADWKATHEKLETSKSKYEASPEVAKAFEKWLKSGELTASKALEWVILDVTESHSDKTTTTLTPQPDGAVLATGNASNHEVYTLKAQTELPLIQSIRIEALTHKSMPRNGPGRAGNGNFALSDLKIFATNGSKKQQLKLTSPRATHEQNKTTLSVASSIDNNPSGTGWAVDAGGIGKDQAAVFQIDPPLSSKDAASLEFHLHFKNNGKHTLGRVRLSVSSLADPPVAVGKGQSESLSAALAALESGEVNAKHKATLFPLFASKDPQWQKLNKAVQDFQAKKPTPRMTKVQVTSEGYRPTKHHADGRGFPHFYPKTYHLNRGDPNQKQGEASQGFLKVLMRGGKQPATWQETPPSDWKRTSFRRKSLSNWITDTENGAGNLLARVVVNRIWHHHFGSGLVSTPNDFGLQGAPPTHPELLEYLASRFVENGWNVKKLHKEILLSSTWLQSTEPSEEKSRMDPNNQYLWRYSPRRLEAEIVRDAMLSASELLDKTMFGPGSLSEGHRRRSIYFMIKRSRLIPMMQIFDQPEPLVSQGSRPSTTIAPQALMFMNNNQVLSYASTLASKVVNEDLKQSVKNLYLRTLSREPTNAELEASIAFLKEQSESYKAKKQNQPDQLALADLSQIMFSLNEFIYMP